MNEKIVTDLKESYGITFDQMTPVSGGYLNLKWKIRTETGDLLVKQYSARRFNREKLEKVERALERQILLEKDGVFCPRLIKGGGRIIRHLDDEISYMVMEFCPGNTETPGTITTARMESLGGACALMHAAFSRLPQPTPKALPGFGGYSLDALWTHFQKGMEECPTDASFAYREALSALEPILKTLAPGFFDAFPMGYAHEDFQPGNILFAGDRVSAIVDFDRNCVSYLWHDIGRAILSFALEGDHLNGEKVRAFARGYSAYLPLTTENIADTLRLTWCIEVPWWIQPGFFLESCDEIPARFRDEILWVARNWDELDSII